MDDLTKKVIDAIVIAHAIQITIDRMTEEHDLEQVKITNMNIEGNHIKLDLVGYKKLDLINVEFDFTDPIITSSESKPALEEAE